jgi:nicotinic acid mononucleotide adenylyltransferase
MLLCDSYRSFYSMYCTAMNSLYTCSYLFIHLLQQDKRQRLETFEHRYNMCWAAFGELPRVTVSDSEYKSWLAAVQDVPPEKRDQVSVGTAALIEYLNKNKNKQDDTEDEEVDVEEVYSFVMGADTFLDLTAGKWKESARVLDLLQGRLVVLEREQLNANSTAGASTGDDNAAATDTADNVALKKAVDAVPGARLLRVDNLNHISSSQVRACPSVVEIREQNMVVPAVLEYMRQHGLYAAFGGDKTE